jgi:hypothetical protein
MGEMVKTAAPGLPGLVDDKAADELAAAFCSMVDPTQGPRDEAQGEGARLPTRDERAKLEQRGASLVSMLRPVGQSMTDKAALAKTLAEFFLGYPSLRNADAEVMLAAYVADLSELPLFAIRLALADIKQGRVYEEGRDGRKVPISPDFPPATPRIIAQAQRRSEPTYALRAAVMTALGIKRVAAPPLPPEKAAALGKSLKELAAMLNLRNVEQQAKEEESRRRMREEAARQLEGKIEAERVAAGLPPTPPGGVVVSPQLADIVGRWRQENEEFAKEARRPADDGR